MVKQSRTKTNRVLIVGAGSAGRLLTRDIKQTRPDINIVGFIDDTHANRNVLGGIADMATIVKREKINEIIIAIPSAPGAVIRRILQVNQKNCVPIRLVKRRAEIVRFKEVKYSGLKDLEPEDWLGRSPTVRSARRMEKFYRAKTVLITGGAGSIGSEIVRQLLLAGVKRAVVYDNAEPFVFALTEELKENTTQKDKWRVIVGDIRHGKKLKRIINRYQPDIVFHVAAYKHVPLMEEYPEEAILNNVVGTRQVLAAAHNSSVTKFVLVSTDKAVNPTSIMGASKRLAEWLVLSDKEAMTKAVVRFGNVINSRGSVLPIFERQIKEGRRVTLTDRRMRRFFMSIREAAELVMASATLPGKKGIFVLDMGDLIKVIDVGRCLIRSRGLRLGREVVIDEIGRRQGEKIIEELFSKNEEGARRKTALAHIWRLCQTDPPPQDIIDITNDLTRLAKAGQRIEIRRYLRRLLPSLDS